MPVSIRGQFKRSIHLERDFYSEGSFEGYIITAKAQEVIERVVESLEAPVAQRAWSVTGPYGGGKSAFALFLAQLMRGAEGAGARLHEANYALSTRLTEARQGVFCPILIVGSREALVPALLRGLANGLDAFRTSYAKRRGRPSHDVQAMRVALLDIASAARAIVTTALDEQNEPAEARLLSLIEEAARVIHICTGGGLFIVVDELGKMLEYASLYPERSDLFVLQRLAERAARAGRGEAEEAPILLFTILHQAFERYAGRLGSVQRDEWRKVQGRFEDVAFVEPVGETLRLLAEAVDVSDANALPVSSAALVDAVLQHTTLPQHADQEAISAHLSAALPLHPAVALLVGPLFRRLAQNERSLFAFLSSGEHHGFLQVVASSPLTAGEQFFSPAPVTIYRLDHLYDYLVANLGATLFSERMEKLWAETEGALGSTRLADPLATCLIKHVAMLNFAGRLAGLEPTASMLASTVGEPPAQVETVLTALRNARLLSFRPFGGT